MTRSHMFTAARMELEYPMSLGVYEQYVKAQHAVDYLADQGFPVQNVEIVGTELRSVERITGRLTRGKLAAAGAPSGFWIGLFVGIAFDLFSNQNQLGFLLTTPLLGALFGLAWSQLGYSTATRRGSRDFASPNQIVAPNTKCSWNTVTQLARRNSWQPFRGNNDLRLCNGSPRPQPSAKRPRAAPYRFTSRRRYSMTANTDNATLYTLGDRGQKIDGSANDVRGREVKDKDGAGIGKVTDLLVDDQEDKIRFLLVEHGGFLGFGEKKTPRPVAAITSIAENEVFVSQSRDRVASAPGYDPDLVDDRPYHSNIYSYYGYGPYLGVGSTHPLSLWGMHPGATSAERE